MFERITGAALIALAAAPTASAHAAPVPLAPTGKWVVEYHPNLCVASHVFGSGAQQVTVGCARGP